MKTALPAGIKDIVPGKPFKTHCIVRHLEIRYKQNGDPYLYVELGDRSGRLPARIWDQPHDIGRTLAIGRIVEVEGQVQVFKQRRELRLKRIVAAVGHMVALEDLLPVTTRNVADLKHAFHSHGQRLGNRTLRLLWQNLEQRERLMEAFMRAPGGKLWHHNHLHGLLEHTANMLDLADVLSQQYASIDIDLLKCGIFCRNLGRAIQYRLQGFVDYTDEGRLLGTKPAALTAVEAEIQDIAEFDKGLRLRLLHLLMFDEGTAKAGEEGLLILPMTLEAILLNQLIKLDAHADALSRIQEKDTLPNSNWTKFIALLNRYVFVGGRSRRNSPPHAGAETTEDENRIVKPKA